MASLNKVILLGNLTRDPELRSAPNGTPVTKTSVKPRPSGRGYKEVGPSAGQFPVDAARQFLLRHRRTF